jgi:hypothetical protein
MLQQSDVEGRLRLFRYGVIVIVVVTFVVTLIAPYSFITSYLRPAIDSHWRAGLSCLSLHLDQKVPLAVVKPLSVGRSSERPYIFSQSGRVTA